MKRVFIFGAGFSNGAGFPAIDDLFDELRVFYADELRDQDLQCLQAFEREKVVVESLIYPTGEKETNFEKFISLLDAGLNEKMLRDEYSFVRKGWLLVLTFFLHNKLQSIKNESFYSSLFSKLNPSQDIVLTFNWDCLAETILSKNTIGWEYRNIQGYSGTELTIYKLHGSINWFLLGPSVRPAHPNGFTQMKTDDIEQGNLYYYRSDDLDKAIDQIEMQEDITPFIVPPTYLKKYYPAISFLWTKAFDEIKSAEEIYILGYSFPELDFFSELFIRLGISQNLLRNVEGPSFRNIKIVIIDKNPDKVLARIRPMVGRSEVSLISQKVDFASLNSCEGLL